MQNHHTRPHCANIASNMIRIYSRSIFNHIFSKSNLNLFQTSSLSSRPFALITRLEPRLSTRTRTRTRARASYNAMVEYKLRQSTDPDAFDNDDDHDDEQSFSPSPAPLQSMNGQPQPQSLLAPDTDTHTDTGKQPVIGLAPASASSPDAQNKIQEVRKRVLSDVKRRAESTEGSGKLEGKVGVITGVGPLVGIGTAAAKLFAREGAKHLYLVDFDDTPVPALLKYLNETYPKTKVTFCKADAASASAISALVDQALFEEGHLDFFFANAGVSHAKPKPQGQGQPIAGAGGSAGPAGAAGQALAQLKDYLRPVAQLKEEEFVEVMRINALSVFVAIKYASEAMRKTCPEKGKHVSSGSIILTASIAGLKSNAGPIPYSASKAAVISMAQTTSYDLTGTNIRVNALCPGLIQTDMTRGLFELAEMVGKSDKMGSLNPAQRQGIGMEVAQAALFLASDDSSYINGQAIPVDGGLTAGIPYAKV
ncbi:hypothetical protein IAT40_007823 [Kwoniella sp. CBS 6097]